MAEASPLALGLATALADAGRQVAVVNPARAKYAGLIHGQGNKTDRADWFGVPLVLRLPSPREARRLGYLLAWAATRWMASTWVG